MLASTGVSAKDINILVINCSLFSPTPSLCSMVCMSVDDDKDDDEYEYVNDDEDVDDYDG